MKKGIGVLFILLFVSSPLRAESLFSDLLEDWSEKIKYGGEVRLRGEFYQNFDFDFRRNVNRFPVDDDEFYLTRTRLFLDMPFNERLRFYLKVQDSHIEESEYPERRINFPASVWEDRFDLYEAFLDVKPLDGTDLTFRLGRQELSYGDERLIGSLDWGNLGRTFQGGKAIFKHNSMQLDLFFANVVIPEDGHLNNSDTDDDFYGAYWTIQDLIPHTLSHLYFLVRDIDEMESEVYTYGTRHEGAKGPVDYEMEFAYQSGEFQDFDHRAWAATVEGGYTFKKLPMSPRFGLEGSFASGDKNPDDRDHETFENLFPTNHKFYGYMDLFSWKNLTNAVIKASIKPHEKVKVSLDFHFFFLNDVDDAWYNAAGKVFRRDPTGKADKHVGNELDFTVKWDINKHFYLWSGYSHFFPGEFIDDTGADDPADWFFLQTTFKF